MGKQSKIFYFKFLLACGLQFLSLGKKKKEVAFQTYIDMQNPF